MVEKPSNQFRKSPTQGLCCDVPFNFDTFEALGKIRTKIRHHRAMKAAEAGKSTRHAHMHTREEVGIAVEIAQDFEASFAWVPPSPLSTEPRDGDDPETMLPLNLRLSKS
ncbi:hypothetical protein F4604DRAFT_1923959 [Suillus subluteus]|nr:hypothetical protein F4604DRAFT_1923959 [Suillus subluteus]